MKQFIVAVVVVVSLGLSSVPAQAHAATRLELLQQIEQLTKLIATLQGQLESVSNKQISESKGQGMQLYLKNLSRSDRAFKNKELSASTGERIGVGWNNKALKDCKLKNIDQELEVIENGGKSEIPSGIQVTLHWEARSARTYDITVECTLKGKRVTDTVRIKYSDPYYDIEQKYNKSRLFEMPKVKGTLSIKQLQATQMQFSGTITPHSGCIGSESMEVVLDYGNNQSKTFTLKECKPISIKETVVYTPSLIPISPTLTLRWVDANRNIWQNRELSRYLINLSNPLSPTITNLGVNGEKG